MNEGEGGISKVRGVCIAYLLERGMEGGGG